MTWDEVLEYCLAKPGAWQDEPWDGDVVAKVGPKIFAFLGSGQSATVGVKCGADRLTADEWLLRYPDDAAVMAYIGRSGWNTLRTGGAIPDDEIIEAIDVSYDTVVSKLPKKDRPLPANAAPRCRPERGADPEASALGPEAGAGGRNPLRWTTPEGVCATQTPFAGRPRRGYAPREAPPKALCATRSTFGCR